MSPKKQAAAKSEAKPEAKSEAKPNEQKREDNSSTSSQAVQPSRKQMAAFKTWLNWRADSLKKPKASDLSQAQAALQAWLLPPIFYYCYQ